jgi:hypothetical protein
VPGHLFKAAVTNRPYDRCVRILQRDRLACVLLACIAAPLAFTSETGLLQISQDPYVRSGAQHRAAVGPAVVAHERTVLAAFQIGRYVGAGADNIGWATSSDGGRNWQQGVLSGATTAAGGPWPAVSLPVAAYDAKHETYLIAMMPFDATGNGRGILVSRSTDAMSWTAPVIAATSAGVNGHWLACDNNRSSPHYGNCYDAYLEYASGLADIDQVVVSRDGGVTWSTPVSSPDRRAGFPTSLAIQPDGHFVILGRNAGLNGDHAYAIASVDGGASLQTTVDITTEQFDYPHLRADPSLTSAVDPEGTIYVVFPDCRFRGNCVDPGCRFQSTSSFCAPNDLLLTTSVNGVTWSEPQRIPIDSVISNVDHFIAGLAAQAGAANQTQLALSFYFEPNASQSDGTTCTSSSCMVAVGFVSSDDAGRTWHPAQKVAGPIKQSWLAQTRAGEIASDYLTPVFIDKQPFGVFALAGPPASKTGLLDEQIFATPLPGGAAVVMPRALPAASEQGR